MLVDTDSQGSASYWARSRDDAGITPRVACIQKFGKGLQGEIQNLTGRYQDIIIDAGGRDSVELRAAMIVAQKAFVPIQASQFDIWTLGRMNDLAATAQGFNPDLRAWVVINRGSTNPSVTEIAQAGEILEEFEYLDLATSVICDRIAYRKATREGLSVAEMKPRIPEGHQRNDCVSFGGIYRWQASCAAGPPSRAPMIFIAGADQQTAAGEQLEQAQDALLPWKHSQVREDVLKVYKLRLPEPYLLKLKHIATHTPGSMQQFCIDVLLPAIDKKVKELT